MLDSHPGGTEMYCKNLKTFFCPELADVEHTSDFSPNKTFVDITNDRTQIHGDRYTMRRKVRQQSRNLSGFPLTNTVQETSKAWIRQRTDKVTICR